MRALRSLRRSSRSLHAAGGQVLEARELADERELYNPGRTVALLGDDQLRHALRVGGRLALVHVHVLAVDERDDVGVLLEGAGLSKVGELRTMVGARLGRAAQLREQDDRYAQFLRESL